MRHPRARGYRVRLLGHCRPARIAHPRHWTGLVRSSRCSPSIGRCPSPTVLAPALAARPPRSLAPPALDSPQPAPPHWWPLAFLAGPPVAPWEADRLPVLPPARPTAPPVAAAARPPLADLAGVLAVP